MNERHVLSDSAIRSALTPPATVQAPLDLAGAIRSAIDGTPQRRQPFLVRALPPSSRPLRLLAIAAALVLLALIALLIAGSQRPAITLSIDESMFRGGPARLGVVAGPGPKTGAKIAWDQPVGGPIIGNMLAVVDGVVYVADGSGGVSAFNATDGAQLWAVNLGSPANTSPAVAAGLVVVGDDAGDVVALDAGTGGVRWKAHTNGAVRSSPAIVDGVIYVGSQDGSLYAFDLADGRRRWPPVDVGGPITRSPAVDDGIVFVGAASGRLTAIGSTGNGVWQLQLDPGDIATPAVHDGLVLAAGGLGVASGPHWLYGLDASTRVVRWKWAAPSGQEVYDGGIDGNLAIVLSADGNVYALALPAGSGEPTLRWSFKTGGPVGSAPAIAGGVVYVSGGDRTVYAVDEQTGAGIWAQVVSGQPGAIAVVGENLYVATDLGRVICISAP
ncbi:MAG TPA: PQQ-binding-like beta-propeller repeat protein [Candidatus Limnocylindrales bacterium]|jgi:outer membrane protein assembly factor BamB